MLLRLTLGSVKSLAVRTLFGFIGLIFALTAALFGPALTLHFWQAWLYLFLFGASSAAITLYLWRHDPALLQRRVDAGPTAEKVRSQQIIQSIASLAFLALMIVPALDRRFSWSRVPLWLVFAGDLLVVLGFYIVFRVFRVNSFTSATVQVTENQTVISTGPYAFVRHPMYSGALIMLLGTPLALGSWFGLFAFPPTLAILVVRLLKEEQLLLADLPGYVNYAARVKRHLVPFIW